MLTTAPPQKLAKATIAIPAMLHKHGGTIKATARGNGLLEGYLIAFGNPTDADLDGQWFTKSTELRLDYFGDYPVLYHHGLDTTVGLNPIGRTLQINQDGVGIWVQAQLNLVDRYAREVYNMVQEKQFGWSSGSVDHLVKIAESGEILRWPLYEATVTHSPAEPHKTTVRALKAILGDDDPVAADLDDLLNAAPQTRESKLFGGVATMYGSRSTKSFVRATLKSSGLKYDEQDVGAIAAELDDPTTMAGEFDDATMADGFDDAMMAGEFDDAVMADEFDAYQAVDDLDGDYMSWKAARRKAARRKARRKAGEFDDAVMADEFDDAMMAGEFDDAMMSDDLDDAMMADEFDAYQAVDDLDGDYMSRKASQMRKSARLKALNQMRKSARPRVKSSTEAYIASLEDRLDRLEMQEAPGESRIGMKSRLSVTRDFADQPGTYPKAFKSYIQFGPSRMPPELLTALNKGERKWGSDDFVYDPYGAVKAINTSTAGSVGFAVPEDFVRELNKNLMVDAVTAAECKQRTTTSDTLLIPDLIPADGRRAYQGSASYPGEQASGQSATNTEPISLGQIQLPVHVMLISNVQTLSALEDVSFDLGAELSAAFSEISAIEYERNIISGNGQGKMRGITVDPRVITSASAGVTSIGGYVASGDSSGLYSGDPLMEMLMHLPPGYRKRAKWVMNSQTALAIRLLKDGIGRSLWGDEQGLNSGIPTTLLGLPIVYNEWADDIASSAYPIILSDLSKGYTIAKRVEFTVRRFDDSAYAVRDQALFLARARFGGMVTQPAAFKVLKIATS